MWRNKLSNKKIIFLFISILLAGLIIFSFRENQPIDGDDGMDCQRVGDLLTPRANHLTTVLNDGKVLIAGGYNAYDKYGKLVERGADVNVYDVEIFHPKTNQFTSAGSSRYPHMYEMSIKTEEGKIVFINHIYGDYYPESKYYGIEIFDPIQNKFIKSKIPPFKRDLSACYIGSNKILVVLGDSHDETKKYKNTELFIYDLKLDTLKKVGTIAGVLNSPHLVKINESEVLLVSDDNISEQKPAIYTIDVETFKIRKLGNFSILKVKKGTKEKYLYIKNVFKVNDKEVLIVYDNFKKLFG